MSLFKRILSNILQKVERRLIDLYEVGSCGCLLGLKIKINTECFQALEMYDSLNRTLYMCDKKIMILLNKCFTMTLLVMSQTFDFLNVEFFDNTFNSSRRSA